MIEFKNVCKSFKQGTKEIQVLSDVNFKLTESGIIALVGKSGSGKSTFLSLLAGLDHTSSGQVYIGRDDITGMNEKDLTLFRAKNIGIVFQQFHLVETFTALENVLLPLEVLKIENPMEKAKQALAVVGLEGRENHFPTQLSGGEKQRVAIARACVTNPQIILADEPSGNLDPETGDKVMQVLFETARKLNQTVILVTHDFELAKKCDHVYELKNQGVVKQ